LAIRFRDAVHNFSTTLHTTITVFPWWSTLLLCDDRW